MANGVLMPKAGITVESCIIGEWLKNVGDQIKMGDILFTYETDKASFECESTAEGELLEIFYEAGDEVPCLVNVCAIGTKGEDCSALKGAGAEAAPAAPAAEAAPAAAVAAAPAATATNAQGVLMPKAGITVESCIIGEWLKQVGDQVKIGDILFTYETDKASFECESTAEGTLLDIFYEAGDEVPCLLNVCAVGTPGDETACLKGIGGTPAASAAAEAPAAAAEAPAAAPAAASAVAVIMPKAGITVESCIIGEWLKQVGDEVKEGDILFTYETDKASFECESTASGTILEILHEAGDEVPCLDPVCMVGVAGAVAAAAPAAAGAAISPRAKNLAQSAGVNAAEAVGTGPNGRIIERDVQTLIANKPAVAAAPVASAAPAPAAAPAPVAAAAPAAAAEAEYKDVKFSGIRRAISKSMSTSLHTMAQLTHNTSFDATAILNYRKQLKAAGGEYAGITLGDIILYAVSRTLLNYPDLNANMLDDNNIRLFSHVNLGVAVDTPRGLMVPTIRHADEMSLLEISKAVKQLAAECRDGAINPDKLSGGSFTVSNLGNMGVESFTPVINPPQTGILGVCGTIDRVRKGKDGGIEIYPAMGLSLTYDHRAVDGTPAAKFQKELGFNLENFTVLLSK
ncbi:MAG: 2-oxo acid dehydrogenase subunit E2 [Oscillospiraceae bacterium]|nr:2-oxo acid dehydrogenase subunit E2 [Oscillospiraceae bacterium]